jgi:hypothetical protein
MSSSCLEATDILADRVSKPQADSASDAISFAVDSSEHVRLLQKRKAALSRLFALIFPKLDQDKTLGQLVDVFTIEIFKRTSRIYGAQSRF